MTRFLDWKGHAFLTFVVRMYLGLVFLLACLHKIAEPQAFAVDVATYQILPIELVNLMAIILPWVELVTALMLLVGFRVRAAALLVNAMMVMFIAAVSIALYKGLDMSCGCFASQSAEEDPISWRTIVRDLGWLALGVYVLLLDRFSIGVDGILARERG